MRIVVAAVACVLLAGCSSTVAGSASEGAGTVTTPATTRATPTKTSPATTTSSKAATTSSKAASQIAAPPTSIDPSLEQQYCGQTITGALGKPMEVVVVETPSGRVNCDQAGAVLVDYYAQRRDPQPGSTPIEVAGFACNQVPEPDIPQVICADGDSLIFSMWRQGG